MKSLLIITPLYVGAHREAHHHPVTHGCVPATACSPFGRIASIGPTTTPRLLVWQCAITTMMTSLSRARHASNSSRNFCTSSRNGCALAVMNIARLRFPMNHPLMAEFQFALGPINEIARNTPGFLWMYDSNQWNLPSFSPPQGEDVLLAEMASNDMWMPQLSMWENLESLQHFVFKSGHAMYFRRKHEWFEKEEPQQHETKPFYPVKNVLWHVPAARQQEPPTLIQAFQKLGRIRSFGPSADAFDLKTASKYCSSES